MAWSTGRLPPAVRLVKRLLPSRLPWVLAQVAARMARPRPAARHEQEGLRAALALTGAAYTRCRPVIWVNTFLPTELVYGLGGIPFLPEVAAAVTASLRFSPFCLREAEARWLSRDTCSFHRAAYGLWLAGLLPRPDAVVVSSHLCDGEKRLFQLLAEEAGVSFHLLEVPYHRGAAAETWLTEQLREVTASLAREVRGLRPAGLPAALTLSNQARAACLAAERAREARPAPWHGRRALSWIGLFFLAFGSPEGVRFYEALAGDLSTRATRREGAIKEERLRLLWLHLCPYYPTDIFRLLDNAGAAVAFDEMHLLYWPELDPRSPYRSLARKMLAHPNWGELDRRVENILALARRFRVDGVVQFGQWGCRQSSGAVPVLKDALGRAGLPFLQLDGDEVDPGDDLQGQVFTRLEAFLEMLWEGKERHAGRGN